MTAQAHEIEETAEAATILHREFAASVTPGDGRTVDVLIVPYGEQIEHDDGFGGVPKGVLYREEWTPGVFSHQDGAANRVLANVEHEEGIRGIVGHGLNLIERSDGFYGSFKMHETPEGEKALMLIREGVFSGVSVEAKPRKSQRTVDGLVRRVKADLVNIAFTRFHAYKRAGVLAVREEADTFEIVDEALQPLGMKPELIERCRSLGIEMPQRYQAHPEQTDTSADADTSEAGTRQTDANTTNTEES